MAKKTKEIKYYEGVGRRKEAVARVRLYILGKDKTVQVSGVTMHVGDIFLNKKPIAQTYASPFEKAQYTLPFRETNNEGRFGVSITTSGGGKRGQLEAILHGMARAIQEVDREAYRPQLKKLGLLTRDPRTKERRKVGMGGKSRREKQSPKR